MKLIPFIVSAFQSLDRREKFSYCLAILARVILAALDVVGVLLLGVAAAVASGTVITANSLTGIFLSLLGLASGPIGLSQFGLVATVFFISKAALALYVTRATNRLIANIETDKAVKAFQHALDVDGAHGGALGVSAIQRTLLSSMEMVFGFGLAYLTVVVGELCLVTAIAALLAITDLALFVVLATYLGCVSFLVSHFVSRRVSLESKYFNGESVTASRAIKNGLGAMRELYTSGRASFIVERFSKARSQMAHSQARTAYFSSIPRHAVETALMFGLAGYLIARGLIGHEVASAPILALFVAGTFKIVGSMLPLQGALGVLSQASGSAAPAFNLLAELKPARNPNESTANVQQPSVRVSDLAFKHLDASKFLFSGVNFSLEANQLLLIEGESGAGKSNLAEHLLGIRSAQKGQITLLGVEPRTFIEQNPGFVGYVSQRPEIVEGTLLENITFELEGTHNIARLEACIELSGLSETIMDLPEGLNTMLGENSFIQLSGGQLQRLGIARLIYQDARLFVLDEPINSLDKDSVDEVIEMINKLKQVATVIVISHVGLGKFDWDVRLTMKKNTQPSISYRN